MSWHEVWHVLVLASTLLGASGLLILLLTPVLFDEYPEGLRRRRPLVAVLILGAVVLILIEWTVVHG